MGTGFASYSNTHFSVLFCPHLRSEILILMPSFTLASHLVDSIGYTIRRSQGEREEHLVLQFRRSVLSDSLRPHEPQHARSPCPSPTPRVYPNACPLCRWCHQAISPSVVPSSSHPQSFPASGSFQMSQLFASGGQSIGVSASTSGLPMNTQD